jgi:hypothetical protein
MGREFGRLTGSHPTDGACSTSPPIGFDPERLLTRLKRIEDIAWGPGKFSGPAFDEIGSLAASCIATIEGRE